MLAEERYNEILRLVNEKKDGYCTGIDGGA